MKESEQNLIDKQDQKNIIFNEDESKPLKKNSKIFNSVMMNISNTLDKEDENKKDDNNKEDKNEDENDKYPIKLILDGKSDSITIIKSKFQTPWVHHYKEKYYYRSLNVLFYIILPLLASINLIGIFQIISVMNALFKVLSNSFLSYIGLEDKEVDLYNFYSFYIKDTVNEGIEFDLIETMSFLGMIVYKFYGYKVSSILFMILNGFSFPLIYMLFKEYNDSSEKYNLSDILYLFGSWALLFIGVGSSALLTQQMLTNNYWRFNSLLKQMNNENDENNNNFIFFCAASIIGALIKYIINISISYLKYKYDQKYNITDFYDIYNNKTNNNSTENEINNIIFSHDQFLFFVSIISTYVSAIILSIVFYYIFKKIVYKDSDESEIEILGEDDAIIKFGQQIDGFSDIYKSKSKYEEKSNNELKVICKFFGYVFYFNKSKKNNDNKKLKNDEPEHDNNKKRQIDSQINNDDVSNPEQEIEEVDRSGPVTIIVNNRNSNEGIINTDYLKDKKKKLKCWAKTCKFFSRCFCSIFFNLKILSYSLKRCVNEIICDNIFCCKEKNICFCCFCCECLADYNCCCCCCNKYIRKIPCCNQCLRQVKEDDYELNDRNFLFCYKSERNLKCFNDFIKDEAQLNFFPLLVEFFLIQLNTIVYNIKVDENKEDEEYIEFINSNILIFILTLIAIANLFFGLTFFFGLLRMCLNNIISKNSKKCCNIKWGEVSNIILNGTFGIVIFSSFYTFFAFYCLSKGWENNFLFYIPILMNKFYYFVFNNHCTVYTDNDKIDYFSSATLLSIYLFVWEQVIKLMKILPITFLLYFQILISSIIILIFLISSIILMIFCCNKDNFYVKFIYDKFIKIKEEDTKEETDINIFKKSKKAIKFYNFPPSVGLKKVNFPNYINSTLQCLSQTEPLTNYFLRKKSEEFEEKKFVLGYFDLIDNLWSKNIITSSIDPKGFINIIKERNPSFKLDQPGNYKELIIFILDNIHKDLKVDKNLNDSDKIEPNEYDQISAFNYYNNKFSKDTSIISNIFFGTNEVKGECAKLKNFSKGIPISYKYQKFNCLKFPLDEISELQNYVTLEDCFKYNQKKEEIDICSYCNEFDSKQTSNIYIAPDILILILDRGNEILSNVVLEFEETIDITQFVVIKEKDKIAYNLYAVLTHTDQNHFFAFCKSPVNKKWYKFDDDKVNLIRNYKKTVINCFNPDILFYQKN